MTCEIEHVPREHAGFCGTCPVVVDVVSSAFDINNIAVGSSPFIGDMSSTGIAVPLAPTPDQAHRYLLRLVVIDIPIGGAIVVLGVHTAATLRATLEGSDGGNACFRPFEILIREPFWQPPGGNIAWMLRKHLLNEHGRLLSSPDQTAGIDPHVDGNDTALLYLPPRFPTYVPPSAGEPGGVSVGLLGTWRDNRDWETYIPVYGPGRVVLYASVHQFDPANICTVTAPTDLGAISQEDRFLFAFPTTAHYGRVAGALSVELWPDCRELARSVAARNGRSMWDGGDRHVLRAGA